MDLIVKSIFGSHLYGTNSELSDTDYKGIFLPTKEECFLNAVKNTINKQSKLNANEKNSSEDIDEEYFSLQYFMKLALNGEMLVIDLLHTPDNMLIESSELWYKLRSNRSKFYSKNLSGYLGYIRKQCSKYGIKGSRLSALKEVMNYLSDFRDTIKLIEVWDNLPVNDYCFYVENKNSETIKQYQCGGQILQSSIIVKYAMTIVRANYESYGERARQAELNEGIDWKAVSHAFRAGYQLKEIYGTNDLIYPLKDAEFIKDIKYGNYHYKNDKIGDKLEDLLLEVEQLSKDSKLPEGVDVNWFNNFILNCY